MKLKPDTILPTPDEDAAITAAALADPDCRPYTDAEWAVARPRSRRQREGWYVGTFRGKHVRRRALLPALMLGTVELFPPSVPHPDNGIAWMTMNERTPVDPVLPLRIRYRSKDKSAEVVVEWADADD